MESAPKSGREVLLWDGKFYRLGWWDRYESKGWQTDETTSYGETVYLGEHEVTHWMPLPEPPTASAERGRA